MELKINTLENSVVNLTGNLTSYSAKLDGIMIKLDAYMTMQSGLDKRVTLLEAEVKTLKETELKVLKVEVENIKGSKTIKDTLFWTLGVISVLINVVLVYKIFTGM